MLEHLLGEILSMIGQGVVVYIALGAILGPLLWLLPVVSPPIARLDGWFKRTSAPHPPATGGRWLMGQAVVWSLVGLIGLALHVTGGLR